LQTAQRLKMPYDEALAYYEMGRQLENGSPQRREYLQNAQRIFEQINAAYDVEKTHEALGHHYY
jgi:hypothetical protein